MRSFLVGIMLFGLGMSLAAAPAVVSVPHLKTLEIPGDPRFVEIARDILEIKIALNPDMAASSGLFEDAVVVPHYRGAQVAALDARLQADLNALQKLPWRRWPTATQVDVRWVWANAQELRQRLTVERAWRHRPGEWLEPVANTLISLTSYAPDRPDLRLSLAALLPDMLTEVYEECPDLTVRDVETAIGLVDGISAALQQLPEDPRRDQALTALSDYRKILTSRKNLPEFKVIGASSYAWRLKNVMLLPWTPDQLINLAQSELDRVDRTLEALNAPRFSQTLSPEEEQAAAQLDRAQFLNLYDTVVEQNLAALRKMNVLTVPDNFPELHARETPAALIPLTGDGGSMNPPLLFGPPTGGWWNVEHFSADWPKEDREQLVLRSQHADTSGLGPYAVHEGVPGHHLQLSLSRQNPDPLRTLLADGSSVEGWALYAEQLFWEGGGFGTSDLAQANMLRSYRGRIRRVFYDVNIESARWNLQQGADWKAGRSGAGIDPDLLRSIQWPTQLITYFAGKSQILALREEVRAAQGSAYSERAFNDALLASGQLPLALVRVEMLGLPVPELLP